jgi:hypothetical protein
MASAHTLTYLIFTLPNPTFTHYISHQHASHFQSHASHSTSYTTYSHFHHAPVLKPPAPTSTCTSPILRSPQPTFTPSRIPLSCQPPLVPPTSSLVPPSPAFMLPFLFSCSQLPLSWSHSHSYASHSRCQYRKWNGSLYNKETV